MLYPLSYGRFGGQVSDERPGRGWSPSPDLRPVAVTP